MKPAKFWVLVLGLWCFEHSLARSVAPDHGPADLIRAEKEDIEQLRRVGSHPSIGYEWHLDWPKRLAAIEKLDSKNLTPEQVASLQVILLGDPNFHVVNEVKTALSGGETAGMEERREKAELKKIGDLASIGYKWDAIWFDRLKAIETLAPTGYSALLPVKLSETQRKDLEKVATEDPDWRIQEEARNLLAGNPTRAQEDERNRITRESKIGDHVNLNYFWDNEWDLRLEGLEKIDPQRLTIDAKRGLEKIRKFDADPRIQEAARRLLVGKPAKD